VADGQFHQHVGSRALRGRRAREARFALRAATVASRTIAPLGSVTIPRILPVICWAELLRAASTTASTQIRCRQRCMQFPSTPLLVRSGEMFQERRISPQTKCRDYRKWNRRVNNVKVVAARSQESVGRSTGSPAVGEMVKSPTRDQPNGRTRVLYGKEASPRRCRPLTKRRASRPRMERPCKSRLESRGIGGRSDAKAHRVAA